MLLSWQEDTSEPARGTAHRRDEGGHSEPRRRGQIRVFSPLFPRARSKWIKVSRRMKSRLQSLEKTRLLFSVWKVTLRSKCSALGWPWEVRAMNVKVDFTLCNSLDCVIDVAGVRADTHQRAQWAAWTHSVCKHRDRQGHTQLHTCTSSNTSTY